MRSYKPGKFGSYFGERTLVRKEPRNLRITCKTDCKIVRISAHSYVTRGAPVPRGLKLYTDTHAHHTVTK